MLSRKGNQAVVDEAELLRAAGAVEDPEIHRPLAELGMLRGATAARDGRVRIEVALTTPGCPLREELRASLTAAARAVPGVTAAEVCFTELSEPERMRLGQQLRGGGERPLGERTRVYAVASGKGGVGKSSLAANLAVALARSGQRVGLLDADVWGYSVPQMFGVSRRPVAVKGVMLPVEAHGVRLMSVGFLLDDGEPVMWRGPMLHKALEQFLSDVHWGELDTLLIDLPPGTGDITMSLIELLPQAGLLVVTTPQQSARAVAARAGRMARELRVPLAGVIENMSALACERCGERTELFGSGGGQRLAAELGTELLGQVPLDVSLRRACDEGTPVLAVNPAAPSAMALAGIAARLPAVRRGLAGLPLPLSVVS